MYEAEDELRSSPERASEAEESKAESFEVEDPYDGPQYNPDSSTEEINIRVIRMAPMSIIDYNNVNYSVKLAVTCQLEKNT
jgi:hypothetical protein